MSEQPLTPLEFVELGNRVTEDQAKGMEIARLIEEARLIVRTALRSLRSSLELLGADEKVVKYLLLLGGDKEAVKKLSRGKQRWWRWSRYARKPPERQRGGRPRTKKIPDLLSVVEGPRRGDRPSGKAVVLQERGPRGRGSILVLGDDNSRNVYPNWTAASQVILDYKDSNYWDLRDPDQIDPDGPLV